jgi:hypothetical protein
LTGEPRLNGHIKLDKSSVYSETKWFYGGKGPISNYDRLAKNSNYNNKKFGPTSKYNGTIKVTSKVRGGGFEDNFFTEKDGEI